MCARVPSRFSRVWNCDLMDCSPSGSAVHGILQARILEWVAAPSSRGSSQPRDRTHVSSKLHWKVDSLPLTSLVAQLVKSPPATQKTRFDSWVGKIHWRKDRLPTPVFLGFPGGSAGKESSCNMGDLGSIPRLGRSPGEGNSYWLLCFGLENSMDSIVHGVAKSQTGLSDFHFTSQHHLRSCSWVVFHACMCHIFIRPPFRGHLSCFHVLAVINSTPMNIWVHVSFRIIVL